MHSTCFAVGGNWVSYIAPTSNIWWL